MIIFRKKISLLLIISATLSFQSCSWMSKRKVLFEEEKGAQADSTQKVSSRKSTVPKAQYDQLLNKYESLLDKIKNAETKSMTQANQQMKGSSMPKKAPSQSDMISQLSKINPPADLAETVDVFGKDGLASKAPVGLSATRKRAPISDSALEQQINTLHKADKLVRQNRMDSALILLKDLEESPNHQIKVRAKFYLAEMLFRQNEYDLAMQMYEEIVRKYAFSGLVIKSLGRLIVCSEKLKLGKKQERYYSILHDFFERS